MTSPRGSVAGARAACPAARVKAWKVWHVHPSLWQSFGKCPPTITAFLPSPSAKLWPASWPACSCAACASPKGTATTAAWGLCYHDGAFLYSHVYDGEPLPLEEPLYQNAGATTERRSFSDKAAFVAWLAHSRPRPRAHLVRAFSDKAAFVAWLAAQTDRSLAGLELVDPWLHRNQRITRRRLEEAVVHARRIPPERWQDRGW